MNKPRSRFAEMARGAVLSSPPQSVVIDFGTLMERRPDLLMHKIAECIAADRMGARLWNEVIAKCCAALIAAAGMPVLRAESASEQQLRSEGDRWPLASSESALPTLARIRDDYFAHLRLLRDALRKLGGEPTAKRPQAMDIGQASAAVGPFMAEPQAALAQSLDALLTVKLTAITRWELLIELAEDWGEHQLAAYFSAALAQEAAHLRILSRWLLTLRACDTTSVAI